MAATLPGPVSKQSSAVFLFWAAVGLLQAVGVRPCLLCLSVSKKREQVALLPALPEALSGRLPVLTVNLDAEESAAELPGCHER